MHTVILIYILIVFKNLIVFLTYTIFFNNDNSYINLKDIFQYLILMQFLSFF